MCRCRYMFPVRMPCHCSYCLMYPSRHSMSGRSSASTAHYILRWNMYLGYKTYRSPCCSLCPSCYPMSDTASVPSMSYMYHYRCMYPVRRSYHCSCYHRCRCCQIRPSRSYRSSPVHSRYLCDNCLIRCSSSHCSCSLQHPLWH